MMNIDQFSFVLGIIVCVMGRYTYIGLKKDIKTAKEQKRLEKEAKKAAKLQKVEA